MSDKIVLSAEPRADVGKGASRRLRRAGEQVPAVVYGGGEPPQSLSLVTNELAKAEKIEAFYSQILAINLDGQSIDAIVKDLQRHPARGDIMHVDLQRVAADQELQVNLALHFAGEDAAPGVKLQGGQALHNMNEVHVACLPSALPEFIEVDVSALDAGQSIHLSDLKLPEGVRIPALELGSDHDQVVFSIAEKKGGSSDDAEGEEASEEGEG